MRKVLLGLGVLAVFGAGCVAGATRAVVPKAQARAGTQWAYFCFSAATADDVHTKANAAGAQGWEMVSAAQGASGEVIWCFRQPRS